MFSLVVVCPVASGDPRQGQCSQHEVAPTMCTVEAVWLDQTVFIVSTILKTKNLSGFAANILNMWSPRQIRRYK